MTMTNNRNRTGFRLHESLVNVIVHVINVTRTRDQFKFLKVVENEIQF